MRFYGISAAILGLTLIGTPAEARRYHGYRHYSSHHSHYVSRSERRRLRAEARAERRAEAREAARPSRLLPHRPYEVIMATTEAEARAAEVAMLPPEARPFSGLPWVVHGPASLTPLPRAGMPDWRNQIVSF